MSAPTGQGCSLVRRTPRGRSGRADCSTSYRLRYRGCGGGIFVRCAVNSSIFDHARIGASARSSGGFRGNWSDHPPHPTSGRSGRRWSHARHASEIVPALPPITMQASPAKAMITLRALPIPHGIRIEHGKSLRPISSSGMTATTSPPPRNADSAAAKVAGLPHPETTGSRNQPAAHRLRLRDRTRALQGPRSREQRLAAGGCDRRSYSPCRWSLFFT